MIDWHNIAFQFVRMSHNQFNLWRPSKHLEVAHPRAASCGPMVAWYYVLAEQAYFEE